MKRTFVVVTLAPVCAVLWAYLALGQDVTAPATQFYEPSVAALPREEGEKARLLRTASEQDAMSQRLVRAYSQTENEAKRLELKARLQTTVETHFTIKQRLRAMELAELEARLEKLRSRHQRRDDARARIVADRVQQLLREADGLGWGSGNGSSGGWSPFGFSPVVPDGVFGEIGEISAEAARRAAEVRGPASPVPPFDPRLREPEATE